MKAMRIVTVVFTLIGLGLLLGGGAAAVRVHEFLGTAAAGEGRVVDLVRSDDSTTYRPVIRFTTTDGRPAEFVSAVGSSPPSYSVGETVGVRYDPAHPERARLDGFFALWGLPLILVAVGTVFTSIGLGIAVAGWRRARRAVFLQQHGLGIQTTFQAVERNTSLRVNGRHPFRIVSQWQDPSTQEVHVFESHNLWFDPSDYVTGRTITVFIDRGNPRRYHMDTSFLPELAE